MKFIDEVTIHVQAGKGGDGCCSFRREKFIPWGGPDGGDGGHGGHVYLKATSRLHTLVDLNYKKDYQAEKGKSGSGSLCSGKSGEHLIIEVPVGTVVWEHDTNEIIGDLIQDSQVLLVANGGRGGLGNHHFKSSTNRSPRKIIKGELGDERNLKLELRLLADVGLLGFPNAGKSTLISKVTAAKPKIADYPFTTMNPHLGVVKVGDSSFVMADVPGLLEGASSGTGLGIRFLKHLSRTRLLLHMVDLSVSLNYKPDLNDNSVINEFIVAKNLIEQINIIENELEKYNDQQLTSTVRWIVINKIDLLMPEKLQTIITEFNKLKTTNQNIIKIFWISAVSMTGVNELCKNIMGYLGASHGEYQ